jgi:SAM-dependent methyltransferase
MLGHPHPKILADSICDVTGSLAQGRDATTTVDPVSEIGLYSDPEVYDILHWPGTLAEFRGLMRAAKTVLGSEGPWTVLEPACGTGRLLRVAAEAGHRAIGFDLAAGMVEYAAAKLERHRGRRHRVFVGDMMEFARGMAGVRVDVAFCPINTIRHLESDAAMLTHFEQIESVLRRDGVYLVGVTSSLPKLESPSEDLWKGSRGRVRVQQIVSFIPPARGRFERVHSHLIVRTPRGEQHRDSTYRLRTYSLEQWTSLVERSPLKTAGTFDAAGKPVSPPKLGYAVWALVRR